MRLIVTIDILMINSRKNISPNLLSLVVNYNV